MQKKYGLANAEKYGLANAEKTCLGQCRKNNKTKGVGASRRPLGDYYFLHWPRHVFWALAHPYFLGFGPCLFFGLWPMLIFWALAPAYFFRYFFWLWPGPAPATFKGFPVKVYVSDTNGRQKHENSPSNL